MAKTLHHCTCGKRMRCFGTRNKHGIVYRSYKCGACEKRKITIEMNSKSYEKVVTLAKRNINSLSDLCHVAELPLYDLSKGRKGQYVYD